MFKKALSASQKIILLRSFCALLALIAVMIPLVSSVSAAGPYDFWDMNPTLTPDGDNTIVSVSIPTDFCDSRIILGNGTTISGSSLIQADVPISTSATIRFYPFGYPTDSAYVDTLSLVDIPSGTKLSLLFDFDAFPSFINNVFTCEIFYYDSNAVYLSADTQTITISTGDPFLFEYVMNKPANADRAVFRFAHYYTAQGVEYTIRYELLSASFSMTLNSLLVQQQQSGRTNAILQKVEQQLADQGKTLEDVLKEQQNMNDKLDELPGQIGDEMQGVIDNEKEESKGEGNKFVDQILDALPDPSTDVLAALKGLTDATAYTGTDAVLPIPAIVLPAIDGLFPETVIWGGTNFDFGEYIALLPSSLLTLVQSLFTIAIVLFCVYELKGIISYCLTLRENKGG